MPFVTEDLWQHLPRRPDDFTPSIMISSYPVSVSNQHRLGSINSLIVAQDSAFSFEEAHTEFERVFSAIKAAGTLAASCNLQADIQRRHRTME
jgi:valyl-tRNA synthetase